MWYVIHSNKTGNKSHRPILRYGQMKLAQEWKITHLSIFQFFYILYYVFCHLHVISDRFSNILPQKIMHFLQPVISKSIGIQNFKGWFLKITLSEKSLMVLYTNGHISTVGGVWTLFWYQIKAESLLLTMISKTHFTQSTTFSCFWGSVSHISWQKRHLTQQENVWQTRETKTKNKTNKQTNRQKQTNKQTKSEIL